MTTKKNSSEENFYFWLGKDGVLEVLQDQEHLDEKINANRQELEDWINLVD